MGWRRPASSEYHVKAADRTMHRSYSTGQWYLRLDTGLKFAVTDILDEEGTLDQVDCDTWFAEGCDQPQSFIGSLDFEAENGDPFGIGVLDTDALRVANDERFNFLEMESNKFPDQDESNWYGDEP